MELPFNLCCVFFVVWLGSISEAYDLPMVGKCCRKGMDKVKPINDDKFKKGVCEDSSVNVEDVSAFDMNICQRVARTCCVKQMQMEFCIAGISRAQKGRECIRHSKVGGDAQRECCDCCYMGIEAKRTGQSCDIFTINFPCDEAFKRCCNSQTSGPITVPTVPNRNVPVTAATQPTQAPVVQCAQAGCSQRCADGPQGAKCYCFDGYALQRDGKTCADRDECQFKPCGSDVCINTPGSYTCQKSASCGKGYQFRNGKCLDLDECVKNPCDTYTERCVNTVGSYYCVRERTVCAKGYELVNGRCVDIDECATNRHNCRSGLRCINTAGSFACFQQDCQSGYQRDAVSQSCVDINECLAAPCTNARLCTNTPGSYECTCYNGWKLKSDKRTCEDIDECNQGVKMCHHRCVNLAGSFVCSCNAGYKRRLDDKRLCDDINECSVLDQPCSWKCDNTPGSFRCLCPSGAFKSEDNRCKDVDECALGRANCRRDQACFNTYGGFKCLDRKCESEFFKENEGARSSNSGQCVRDCSKFTGSKRLRCGNIRIQSIRWWATSLTNGVGVGSYKFTYRIQPAPGYSGEPTVRYKLENSRGYFSMDTSREKSSIQGHPEQYIVTIANTRELKGPDVFILKLTGDVVVNSEIISTFISYLKIFISEYNFI